MNSDAVQSLEVGSTELQHGLSAEKDAQAITTPKHGNGS